MKNNAINLQGIVLFFKSNISTVFFVVFVVSLIGEALIVKDSLKTLSLPEDQTVTTKGAVVRINFDNFDAATQRVKNADSFFPTTTPIRDPFGTK